ncbi:hypothetical protein GCM10025759_28730 [Lysobacter panacisoli]|uniref:Uncharacterized protein n=1 Tax=Lysobacter panacisoli TaxID=1255263 RepID=A0ABP9LN87_9GAMM
MRDKPSLERVSEAVIREEPKPSSPRRRVSTVERITLCGCRNRAADWIVPPFGGPKDPAFAGMTNDKVRAARAKPLRSGERREVRAHAFPIAERR